MTIEYKGDTIVPIISLAPAENVCSLWFPGTTIEPDLFPQRKLSIRFHESPVFCGDFAKPN